MESEEITVRERMIFVMSLFEEAETVEFSKVFRGSEPQGPSRSMIVATFLAILELARRCSNILLRSSLESVLGVGGLPLAGDPALEDAAPRGVVRGGKRPGGNPGRYKQNTQPTNIEGVIEGGAGRL